MATITADLVPGAARDHAALGTLDPQPHARRVQTAQGEIDLAQERRQRLDISRLAQFKIRYTSRSSEPVRI